MGGEHLIKSVAIIGAGASGVITAAALKAENYFEKIRVFERRETAGGTWIFDQNPGPGLPFNPGRLPPEIDPPLQIPDGLPTVTAPCEQERYLQTPVYESLTTNVPDIAMCFSDERFAYGPFPPHYVPRQYLENYVALHKLDKHLVLNTTVEDLSRIPSSHPEVSSCRWRLTLRKHDVLRRMDIWWTEIFDAVVIANGHYAVPFIPHVEGLEEYQKRFPDRVIHSKHYRSPTIYSGLKVLTIGNSASGFDIFNELTQTARLPVYSSRRSKSPFEGDEPAPGIRWKPIITQYHLDGRIEFEDGSVLRLSEVDKIIYCTGYRPSFPFWNIKNNGRPIYDYENGKLVNVYWHTFFHDLPTLGLVGIQKALTFRSFEYQAVALARLFTKRNVFPLPPAEEQRDWELERLEIVRATGKKFHDIQSQPGGLGKETFEFLGYLYRIAGLGTLKGDGRIPPILSTEVLNALKNLHKYPTSGQSLSDEGGLANITGSSDAAGCQYDSTAKDWVLVERG